MDPLSTPKAQSPEQEWTGLLEDVPLACRLWLSNLVQEQAPVLATEFYAVMMNHPQAQTFLDHHVVEQRLTQSMQQWVLSLFRHPAVDVGALVAQQRHVGEVHARVQLPIHLVARGARQLKRSLFAALLRTPCPVELVAPAQSHVSHLIDLALELMSEAYLRNSQRGARNDEAYRLFSLGQNLSVERERQRSALLEWSQDLLFSLHRHSGNSRPIPALGSSEFGLWFHHKGSAMFDGVPEMEILHEAVRRIDESLLPRLRSGDTSAPEINQLLIELQQELENLKFQLKTLFERQVEVENGRDTLTRLLNRRFLPSVVLREIKLANERRSRFGVLLLDVDHFKRINDEHGHDAGDLVLQQAAMLILDCVRNGDFVFRYGGEEILIVMVELDAPALLRAAETLRQRFASHEFVIGQGRKLAATISIGATLYDGHPDYQYLVTRADEALYRAKNAGRNCVASSIEPAELDNLPA